MSKSRRALWAILAVAVLAAGSTAYVQRTPDGATAPETARAAKYHCPMHPTMVSDQPGDCPMCGMRLVPTEEGDGASDAEAHATASPDSEPPSVEHRDHAAPSAGKKKLVYRSTMNPGEISDRPGKDSMGMEMVPEEVDEPPSHGPGTVDGRITVKISGQKRQLIGVRTAPAARGPFTRTIRTVGRVTYDESRLRTVFTKVSGWVERLYANSTGQMVKAGEPLLGIYSPELVSSAEEYLLALRGRDRLASSDLAGDAAERLVESARRRLLLFDLTAKQIAALKETGQVPTAMTLEAPIGGTIIARYVTQGDRIEPGTKLLEIADLSRVWVLADIYEYELPFVQVGQVATMTLSYLPGRTFEGRITFVYPVLSEATRTVKVRLEFPNPDLALKPEMYAQVEIHANLGERLTVPESAVITTGTRDIVFVDRGEGYFEPRELELGMRLPDRFEVLGGLVEGEPVLISGNFLVDSESKLKAALAAAGTGGGSAGKGSGAAGAGPSGTAKVETGTSHSH